MTEEIDLGTSARLARLRQLYSAARRFVATGRMTHADDPTLIAALFTEQERVGVKAIAERLRVKVDAVEAQIDAIVIDTE